MNIIWTNLRLIERYITGDQWGPLIKLWFQDYEVHLHMNPLGTAVRVVGTVRNIGGNIRLNRYNDDVAPALRMVNPPLPPNMAQAATLFANSAAVPTTYHQWLRTETTGLVWTLGCGRAQQHRMRGHKPAYHP